MGEMSKIDSKVAGFKEAEGSFFLSRNLSELTKNRSFKSHKFLRLTIAGEGELVSGRVASLFKKHLVEGGIFRNCLVFVRFRNIYKSGSASQ